MITRLEIENFKGIAARQRIDFAPLTLLFGANNAGKSTILQALLYLHELLERGNADVDRTELGGSVVELGGFARLVHGHDTSRSIIIRAEFSTPGGLERFGRDLIDFPFPDLDDDVESAWIEITVGLFTTTAFRGPLITRVVIGTGDRSEPLVWIEPFPLLREGTPLLARVNLDHPLIVKPAGEIADSWKQVAVPEEDLRATLEAKGEEYASGADEVGGLDLRSLPTFCIRRSRLSALPPIGEPLRVLPVKGRSFDDDVLAQVQTFLEMIVVGTIEQLASFLRDTLYIGPLRATPPQGFLYEHSGRITNWADGFAAWDLLLKDRGDLLRRTNVWLARLGSDLRIVVQQLFNRDADAEHISEGHVDLTVRRLLLETEDGALLLPSEVGAGISQIIPVIVAAGYESARLSLIEQPELHIHPAMQAKLGDLFIKAVTLYAGNRRTLVVETHSEHLILRLLRRIRETTSNELQDDAPAFSEDKLSVLYVESNRPFPNSTRIRRLRVDELGEFKDPWPRGFFEERAEELF